MAEQVQPIFSINDFPTEIVERFAPDLRPRTVSTLRLVSPRFRDVFTSDRYYRSYLCYTNRLEFYREDLEEIGEARDRWRRCLEAEKRRLDNWRHGRPTRVEKVQIPSDVEWRGYNIKVLKWSGEVGEGQNYWMMCEMENRKIILSNVAKDPIMTVVDVSSYTTKLYGFAHLLPDQVVIDSGGGSKQVFKILKDGSNLALNHIFTIEAESATGAYCFIGGVSNLTKAFRNFYVSFVQSGVFKVWDLKRGVSYDSSVVIDYLFPRLNLEFGIPNLQQTDLCVTVSKFPYFLLLVQDRQTGDALYYLAVNVEENRVACCVAPEPFFLYLDKCYVNGHELLMAFYDGGMTEIRIYDLRPHLRPGLEQRLIFRQSFKNYFHIFYEQPWLVSFSHDRCTKIVLTRVDDAGISIEIDALIPIVFRAIVGPFVLMENSDYDGTGIISLLTYDAAGDLVFNWSKVLEANGFKEENLTGSNLRYFPLHFRTLSTFRDSLFIFHF